MNLFEAAQLKIFTDHCHKMLDSFKDVIELQKKYSVTFGTALFFSGAILGMGVNPSVKVWVLMFAMLLFFLTLLIHTRVANKLWRKVHETDELTKQNPFEQEP